MHHARSRILALCAALLALLLAAQTALADDAPQAHLIVTVDTSAFSPGLPVLADFYVDGNLAAAQVPSLDTMVSPGSHKIAVKNVKVPTIPPYGLIWKFKDGSATATLKAGDEKTVAVKVVLEPLNMLLELGCNVKDWAGEDVTCLAEVINPAGVSEGFIVVGDPTTQLPWKTNWWQEPGVYTVNFSLIGAQANLWSPAKVTSKATVTVNVANFMADKPGGKASATFSKAGHLTAALSQPGVVGDFYLDGALVAAQAATIDQWVAPGKAHKLEVKNLTDPDFGAGVWANASVMTTVASGKTKNETIKLKGAPVSNMSLLKGSWSGQANTASGTFFTITFVFKGSCNFGSNCGTFKINEFTCSGSVKMLGLVDGVYHWTHDGSGCGGSPPTGIDTVTLNADGTLHYRYEDANGWSDGVLTKQ